MNVMWFHIYLIFIIAFSFIRQTANFRANFEERNLVLYTRKQSISESEIWGLHLRCLRWLSCPPVACFLFQVSIYVFYTQTMLQTYFLLHKIQLQATCFYLKKEMFNIPCINNIVNHDLLWRVFVHILSGYKVENEQLKN